LETFVLIRSHPDVKRCVFSEDTVGVCNPTPAPINEPFDASLLKGDEIVGRVMQRKLRYVTSAQFLHVLHARGIQTTDAVFAAWIFPHLALMQSAILS
jgi:hypothetical protein